VRDLMTSHLRETGKQLVTDPERQRDPVEFVQRLLDEKDKYDLLIAQSFGNDKTFQNALNSSFEFFINLNTRSPEFISLFVDDKLKKGLKGVSEEDVEGVLDKVMMLFR
jgi:cullin 3